VKRDPFLSIDPPEPSGAILIRSDGTIERYDGMIEAARLVKSYGASQLEYERTGEKWVRRVFEWRIACDRDGKETFAVGVERPE